MSRMERINEHVKREVSTILMRELGDPRLSFVSITRAEVSPDLQHARIYFSVLGKEKEVEAAQEGLNGAAKMVRRLLGKALKIRFTPELSFFYDDSIVQSFRMEKTFKDIKDDRQASS
jgi:ribosome-binding factor A